MDHGVKWSLQDNQNVSLLWAVIPTGQQMHMFVSNKIVDDVGGLVVVVCKFPKNVVRTVNMDQVKNSYDSLFTPVGSH